MKFIANYSKFAGFFEIFQFSVNFRIILMEKCDTYQSIFPTWSSYMHSINGKMVVDTNKITANLKLFIVIGSFSLIEWI